ncbi:MAG TPA: hypothetical protein VN641_10455 [Urbifossiella sp.]|nr:hypothetical protein [Urbifossiella sp.]
MVPLQFVRRVALGSADSASRLVLAVLLLQSSVLAAEPEAAARATSPAASFVSRAASATEFFPLPENSELCTGDLIVALPGASFTSKNGSVAVKSLADYDGKSPLPVLETAFTLNEAKDVDLDIALDRGRVDFTNVKAEGAAVVRARFWNQSWKITLDAKGTRVALELCARWPAGSRFKLASGMDKPPEPIASLVLLVISGSAAADVGGLTLGLSAPPGPALVEWDSVAGVRPQRQKLDKLPAWADPDASLSPHGKKVAEGIEKFRKARAENAAGALKSFIDSADPIEQRIALVTLGATDDLVQLLQALAAARNLQEWDFGIAVVRHWLGRTPGNERKLYDRLVSPVLGFTPNTARTIIQLLFGFSADDLRQPETYEVLIEYLRHDQPSIRNLAAWHLVRLVPVGKTIAFKPNGTKAEAETAYGQWKKLIPSGMLPPPPKKK